MALENFPVTQQEVLDASQLQDSSKSPLFLFTSFLLWSQGVSASSVTGVGWCISHERCFRLWTFVESKVQLRVSPWTVSKPARSYWVGDMRPHFSGQNSWVDLETPGFQLLGNSPREAGLKQSTKEAQRLQFSNPAREFLLCLHTASVQWNQDHQWAQAGKEGAFWLRSAWCVRSFENA